MKKRLLSLLTVIAVTAAFLPAIPASAATSVKIGDYIQMGVYYGEPILWRCVSFEKIKGYDSEGNPIVDSTDTAMECKKGYLPLVISDKIICMKPYDSKTSENSSIGSHSRNIYRPKRRSSYGSNYWADSNMRSWLNSEAIAGKVKWLCGNPPSKDYVFGGYDAYDQEAGFLYNFTRSEKNVIEEVTLKSIVAYSEYSNGIYTFGSEEQRWHPDIDKVVDNYDNAYSEYVTDKMFLLDIKQLNTVHNNGRILGNDYYIGVPTAKAVENSDSNDYDRFITIKAGEKDVYWLRTPATDHTDVNTYSGSECGVRTVGRDGNVGSSSAGSDAYIGRTGVRPAFYLNLSSVSFTSGSGTLSAPYRVDGTGGGSDELAMPSDINSVTINYKGTAYGYFKVTDASGNALKNKNVTYKIDGGSAKSGTTDAYGYLCVQINGITKSKDYNIAISGSGVKSSAGTLSVTVTPLEFSSSYEATLTKGAEAALGIGVSGKIGNLGAEAQAAEIGLKGSNKKGLSYSQERKNGKTKLTVTAKENNDAALKAKVGLWAGADAKNVAGAEISAGDIHGSAKYGNSTSVGFEDEDFNWNDSGDVQRLALFMVNALLENMDSNVATRWLLEQLSFGVDTYEKGSTASISAGASIGSVKVKAGGKDIASGTIGGIDGDAVWSQSTKTAKDKSVTRKSSVAADAGFKLGEVSLVKKDGNSKASSGTAVWGKKLINNKYEFSAKNDKNGKLTSLGISWIDDNNNDIFWTKHSTSDKRTITYKDDTAKAVAASYQELQDLADGNKYFFTLGQMRKASDAMTNSNQKGEFSASTTKTKGVDVNASASIQLLLKLGGELGISGTESYTYDTEKGIYENNTVYTQAKNDIDKAVADEFFGIEDAFGIAAGYMGNIISGYWDTIGGWIDSAVNNVVDAGKAAVKKTKDTLTGWKVSITTAVDKISPFSVMAVDSEFSLFSTSSVATTIGNPYIVSVEDEDGNEITDLSENPLMLTLEYDDDTLAEAGVDNVNDIAIYRWDEDKCVYIRMGGTLDAASKSMSLEITKTGQYILAVDNCPPAVTEFKASDGGNAPEISAVVSDMSGIAEFAFTIDGNTLVNNDNLNDYYDHTTAQFVYPTSGLSAGTHTAVIYASDSAGNELSGGVTLEFTVSTDAPVISNVTNLGGEVSENITVSANVDSANLSAVFLNVEDNGVRSSYEMTETDGVYTASADGITDSAMLKVWVSAYDINGNEGVSDKQTVLFAGDDAALFITNATENSVTVKALNCDGLSGKVILALYDDEGKLIDIVRQDLQGELVFENVAKFTSAKAMLWDGLTSMTPLAKADSIEINNLN